MNIIPFPVQNRTEILELITRIEVEREKMRMDFLSDPKSIFHYSIKSDGKCVVTSPYMLICSSLRKALDVAIERQHKKQKK